MAGENAVVENARAKEVAEEELTKVNANARAKGEKAHASVREEDETRVEMRREEAAMLDKEEVEKKEKEMKDTIRSLKANLEMARKAAENESDVPITPNRQNIHEISILAIGEVPISPSASEQSFVSEPNEVLCDRANGVSVVSKLG